jgi:hypothetical protein
VLYIVDVPILLPAATQAKRGIVRTAFAASFWAAILALPLSASAYRKQFMYTTPLPVRHAIYLQGVAYREGCVCTHAPPTPAKNEGCTRSLRTSHTSRPAPLQPVSKTQVPCTPYHPPNVAGVCKTRPTSTVCILQGVYRPIVAGRVVTGRVCISLPVRHAIHIRCVSYREGWLHGMRDTPPHLQTHALGSARRLRLRCKEAQLDTRPSL